MYARKDVEWARRTLRRDYFLICGQAETQNRSAGNAGGRGLVLRRPKGERRAPDFTALFWAAAQKYSLRGNARKRARGAFKKAARSALALFMALVLGTDNHNLAVPFDYLALIAHRLYRRSNFHNISPFVSQFFRAGRARKNSWFEGPAPLCAILSALIYLIAQIHPAEAQVCANWVFLRKDTLLETFIPFAHEKSFCCAKIFFRDIFLS